MAPKDTPFVEYVTSPKITSMLAMVEINGCILNFAVKKPAIVVKKVHNSTHMNNAKIILTGTGMDVQDGMGYKDYMRMLLFLEGKERMSMRAMGIIEKNMQSIYGQPAFRIDYCAGRMEIRTVCNLRRGIKYQYRTYYGYQ